MIKQDFVARVNQYASEGTPFIFIIDFELERPAVFRLDVIDSKHIKYDVNGETNVVYENTHIPSLEFAVHPMPKTEYSKSFDIVFEESIKVFIVDFRPF